MGVRAELARRRWFPAVAGLLVILAILTLRFGNTQWNRWIYVFQAYVWPGREPEPSSDYCGPWFAWYSNGRIAAEAWTRNGEAEGPFLLWDTEGHLHRVFNRQNGSREGWEITWDQDGRAMATGQNYYNEPFEGRFYNDYLKVLQVYRQGEPYDGLFHPNGAEIRVVNQGTTVFQAAFDAQGVPEQLQLARRRTMEVLERERKEKLQRPSRCEPLEAPLENSGHINEER
jgi:hypothetical protein